MIIDAHTHFYDPHRPQGVPWPNKEDGPIYRTVLPEHHRAVAEPTGVSGTVVTAASVWLEDNQWLLDLAANDSWIVGVVGHVDSGPSFGTHIKRFAADPLYRGIRAGPEFVADDGSAMERAKTMADHDLQVDISVSPQQAESLWLVARQVPDLRWVLNHCGQPKIDGQAPDPDWVEYVRTAAAWPQIFCKVSGLVEYSQVQPAPADLEFYLPTLEVLWDAFGEDRLIYGSNWPVCEISSSHATVQAIVGAYFKSKGTLAAQQYFWQNAAAAYKYVQR